MPEKMPPQNTHSCGQVRQDVPRVGDASAPNSTREPGGFVLRRVRIPRFGEITVGRQQASSFPTRSRSSPVTG